MSVELTLLERALLDLIASENWSGFRVDGIVVRSRDNTGVGRYTHLDDCYNQTLCNGTYGAQGRLLEMAHL